jgi:transcriptional antiterminator RfaH
MTAQRKWCVVHTHAHAEAMAVAHLQRQGFETYCPQYLRRKNHARRTTVSPAPFFPRYIFVAIDMATQRWHAIRSTLGVSYLIGGEKGPTPVADAVVAQLRASEGAGGFIPFEQMPRFRRGEHVSLRDNIFSSCTGIFDGLTDSGRVAVLLDLLGRKVRVILDGTAITAA